MRKYIPQDIKAKTFFPSFFIALLLIIASKQVNAQAAFTANWPLSSDLVANTTGNVIAQNATNPVYVAGTGGIFGSATPHTFTANGLTGTGIQGKAASAADILYNSVGATSPITPYIEFTVGPTTGNTMTVNTLSFNISTPNVTTSGRVMTAGYSVDGGATFTGFTPSTTSSGATANTGPNASLFSITAANVFSFSLPASVNVANGSSFKIRILIWRNNSSGSAGSAFTISPISISGVTTVSSGPIAPTIGTLTVTSPKVVGDAPFTLTDPASNSTDPSATFSYISSNPAVATISGKTVTIIGAGTTTITATQAAGGAYGSGSTSANLVVLDAPETPAPQTLPYTQDFGNSAFSTLPSGFVVWRTASVFTSQSQAESSSPYAKGSVTSRTTALTTSLTPSNAVYGYGVPDANSLTNASVGFLVRSTNSPQLAMAINTIGQSGINLNYDVRVEKVGDSGGAVVAQYRLGNSGTWTTISGSLTKVDALGSLAVNLTLPADCNNQPNVQIRWVTWNALSCIFALDNIAISAQASVINSPLASNISPTSAILGATIAPEAGSITEKGTVYSSTAGVLATDNKLVEGSTALGTFGHERTALNPETLYYFKGYGVSSSQTFLSTESSFRTLSAPALSATTNHAAVAVAQDKVDVSWAVASFPSTGASASGYLLLRANHPDVPSLTNANGLAPVAASNTIIVNDALANTATSLQVNGLNANTKYNFLLVPYTWDGLNLGTRNYYTSNLVAFNATTLSEPSSVVTAVPTFITHNSVSSGGTSVNNGGGTLSAKGVVWSTSANPTLTDNKLDAGTLTSDFTSQITGLSPQILYNIRAYATNNAGTQYGANLTFRTLSTPILAATTNNTAVATAQDKVNISWTAASFPATGATASGYLLLRANHPDVPSLTNTNGVAPVVAANTVIVSDAIASTAGTFQVSGLNSYTRYNFVMVPYTWDGVNLETRNYYTTNLIAFDALTLPGPPSISTVSPTAITHNSVSSGASDVNNGGGVLSAKGVVWSTSINPTLADNKQDAGTVTSDFTSEITALSPQTLYNIRAYATNSNGTAYGENVNFRTRSSPALSATSNHTAVAIAQDKVDISWTNASFPATGATVSGYLLLRSNHPNVPSITNLNGVAPAAAANTIIVSDAISGTANSYQVSGLDFYTRYNFVLVPYTWDGVNLETRNYYTTNLIAFDELTFAKPSSVTTLSPTSITYNSVSSGGSDVKNGGGVLSAKGVVWSTSINPTTADNKLDAGTATSDFTSEITGLNPQTLYNMRAYATNNAGTQYGENKTFRTLSNPVTVQANNFTALSNNSSGTKIDLSWTAASFPATGASVKGYVILYSAENNVPTFASKNGEVPTAGVNTFILSSSVSGTATSFNITNLVNSQSYNYLLIPYTWDGTNASTYNYLTTDAAKATSIKLPILTAAGPTTFCIGNKVTLSTNVASGNSWFRNGIAIAGANAQQYIASESGLYTARVNWGTVTTTSQAIQVTVNPLPVPSVTSTEGTKISKGFTTQLNAFNGVTYKWSPNIYQWIDNPNIPNPIVKPDVTTTFTVTVTNANGCVATESITIEVDNDYKITPQTMMTPNGDGKNDLWIIKNIESYPDNEVKILYPSGKEIYRKKRYNNSFDGTFNGDYLPTGTYLYVIYLGESRGTTQGYLTILR
jgi:gliding motility-associated-like protein